MYQVGINKGIVGNVMLCCMLCYFPSLCTAALGLLCDLSQTSQLSPPGVSTRVTMREHPAARNIREFCLNTDLHVTFRNLFHAVKLRHGTEGFTSPPKEGVLRIFFALKILWLRPGVNPQTWVPKASTLPLDHRSR